MKRLKIIGAIVVIGFGYYIFGAKLKAPVKSAKAIQAIQAKRGPKIKLPKKGPKRSLEFRHAQVIQELKQRFEKRRFITGKKDKYSSIEAFLAVYPVGGKFFQTWNKSVSAYKLDGKKARDLLQRMVNRAGTLKAGKLGDENIRRFLKKVYFDNAYLKKLVKKNNPKFKNFTKKDIDDYVQIIQQMSKKEKEMRGYNVFYHGHNTGVGLFNDIISAIRSWVELKAGQKPHLRLIQLLYSDKIKLGNLKEYIGYWTDVFAMKDWNGAKNKVYNDWQRVLKSIEPKRFGTLKNYDKENWSQVRGGGETMLFPYLGNWVDNIEPYKSQILCVNFSPFAFIYNFGENSLAYFIADRSIKAPDWIDAILMRLGFEKKFIDKLKALHDKYMQPKKGGQMLQIFIPKDNVDRFVYISKPMGIPLIRKIYGVGYDAKMGYHTKTSEFLSLYLNDPSSLKLESDALYVNMCKGKDKDVMQDYYAFKVINGHQGRIVLFPGFFDSKNGVEIVKYNFVPEKNKEIYRKKFNQIFEDMIFRWMDSGAYKKLGDDIANKRLVRLLDFIKRGEKYKEEQAK
ncbi:hypothetical protein ACFLYU_00685 [Candidatus Dependentiae bacterium]